MFSTVTLMLLASNCPLLAWSASEKIYVEEDQGFVYRIELRDGPFPRFDKCIFTRNSHDYPIDITSKATFITAYNETVASYSATACGVRVSNVNSKSRITDWYLTAKGGNKTVRRNLKVEVLDTKKDFISTNLKLYPGSYEIQCQTDGTVSCLVERSLFDQNSCKRQEIIRSPATYSCSTWSLGRMNQISETIRVQVKESESRVRSTMTHNDDATLMSCQFSTKIQLCRAELPGRERQLLIRDNMLSGRFSSFDTNLDKGLCTLEIRKPVEESDYGIWRIYELSSTASAVLSGCIFYNGDKADLIESELKLLDQTEDVYLRAPTDRLDIFCEAPFIAEACYIRDPNKAVFILPKSGLEITQNLGLCRFTSQPHVSGEWTCGLIGLEGTKEVIKKIKVSLEYNLPRYTSITEKVSASAGDTVELVCRHERDYPIESCAFTGPDGNTHILFDAWVSKKQSRFEYFGEGFNHGYCGIKIHDVQQEDFGEWLCVMTESRSVVRSNNVSYASYLVEDALSAATVAGIAIGAGILGLVVITGGGYLVYKKYVYHRTSTTPTALYDLTD